MPFDCNTSTTNCHSDLSIEAFIERFEKLSVTTLTVEGRIVAHLTAKGRSRIKEVMLATGASYRGFYLALDKLKEKGVVISVQDPSDKRARLIALDPRCYDRP